MRILVAGWFSLADGGATAGDLLVRDVVCSWLRARGIDHDVAQRAVHGPGVDWFRVSPERYSDLIVACGPVGPDLPIAAVIERFAGCRRIAVDVSLVGPRSWRPFDVVLERDGRRNTRPDLSLVAPRPSPVPVVARIEIHQQAEYPGARPQQAHAAFDRLLASREAAVIHVDMRLAPAVPNRRSPKEIMALLGRADVALTTRLHGLMLSLSLGIPVVAVDPVVGGAKIARQATILRWPAAIVVDALTDDLIAERFAWCLSAEARTRADTCARLGRRGVADIETALERTLRRPHRIPRRLRPSRAE